MENEFQNKWKEKLEEEREKVLIWERPYLPPIPKELTEESVTLYIEQIRPQLNRRKNRLLLGRLSNMFDFLGLFVRHIPKFIFVPIKLFGILSFVLTVYLWTTGLLLSLRHGEWFHAVLLVPYAIGGLWLCLDIYHHKEFRGSMGSKYEYFFFIIGIERFIWTFIWEAPGEVTSIFTLVLTWGYVLEDSKYNPFTKSKKGPARKT
jgi:hypothetical protein